MNRNVLIVISQIIAVVLLAFVTSPIPASSAISTEGNLQRQVPEVWSKGPLLAQEGPFRGRLREREEARMKEVERDLQKNPNLVNDPNYLARHPKLAHYLDKHPEAKAKIKQDPNDFFQHLEDERHQRMGE